MRRLALLAVLLASGCAHVARLDSAAELKADHATFDLRFDSDDKPGAQMVQVALTHALPKVERWGPLERPVDVRVFPSHGALEDAVDRSGYGWLRAWARYDSVFVQSPRTWSIGGATQGQLDELLTHELTHCVMYQQAASPEDWQHKAIPIWFREGMASVTADQGYRRASLADLKRAFDAGEDPLLGADRLYQRQSELVYSTAHHAFQFLVERYGDASVRALLATMRDGNRFDDAFHDAIGIEREAFEREFRRYVVMDGWRIRRI